MHQSESLAQYVSYGRHYFRHFFYIYRTPPMQEMGVPVQASSIMDSRIELHIKEDIFPQGYEVNENYSEEDTFI